MLYPEASMTPGRNMAQLPATLHHPASTGPAPVYGREATGVEIGAGFEAESESEGSWDVLFTHSSHIPSKPPTGDSRLGSSCPVATVGTAVRGSAVPNESWPGDQQRRGVDQGVPRHLRQEQPESVRDAATRPQRVRSNRARRGPADGQGPVSVGGGVTGRWDGVFYDTANGLAYGSTAVLAETSTRDITGSFRILTQNGGPASGGYRSDAVLGARSGSQISFDVGSSTGVFLKGSVQGVNNMAGAASYDPHNPNAPIVGSSSATRYRPVAEEVRLLWGVAQAHGRRNRPPRDVVHPIGSDESPR